MLNRVLNGRDHISADLDSERALSLALKSKDTVAFLLLIKHGCCVDLMLPMAQHGYLIACQTPLMWGISRNDAPLVEKLLEHGADPNYHALSLENPLLIRAAKNNFHDIATMLVEYGADVDCENSFGWTALHFAAAHPNRFDTINTLIKHNACLESIPP